MKEQQRTQKAMKNAFFSILSYVILTVSTLITRWVFVAQFDTLASGFGTELSGVESLFKSVISMLALAELGIGTGLVYLLYKPIAEDNKAEIHRILNFYKRAYTLIAGIVMSIGLLMAFVIHRLAKDTTLSPWYIGVTFFLYTMDTLASYLFAHQRALLIADQKNYLNNINEVGMNFLTMVLQVTFLVLTRNFVVYILIRVACRAVAALLIHRNFKRMYPELNAMRERDSISGEQRRSVFATLYAMLFHKIGGVASHKAGILIISSVLGTVVNGMYSYYLTVTDAVTALVTQTFSGITASFGDYLTGGDTDAAHEKFNILYYFNFVISCFCSTALLLLIQPFIGMWVGEENRLSSGVALLVAAYFYIYSLRRVIFLVRDSTGLYRPDRYLPLLETAVNVGLSLTLAFTTHRIEYVLLANVASMALLPLWVQPCVVYKHVFKRSPAGYFRRYALYTVLTAVGMAGGGLLCRALPAMGAVPTLLCRAVISVVCAGAVCLLPFLRTMEFRYLLQLLQSMIKRKG
ncbi:MAG: hypothetical protein E7552_05005 [Ruminococcaceae bacterium]|nr:hypothetical protein [Oscillospiraceae bacterium]